MQKKYYVESGDLFSFARGGDERDAAKTHVLRIMQLRGGTLGEKVVVKDDYGGTNLTEFNTEDMLSNLHPSLQKEIKFKKINGIIVFTKVPTSRSCKRERRQGIFHKDESMSNVGGVWIRQGVTKKSIIG